MFRPIFHVFPMLPMAPNGALETEVLHPDFVAPGMDRYCSVQGIGSPGGGGLSRSWRFEAVGLTDIGLKRAENQDAFSSLPELGLFVVADGMGGHRGGRVASVMAVDGIRDFLVLDASMKPVERLEALRAAFHLCSSQIYSRGSSDVNLYAMGTTLAVLSLDESGGRYYIAHAGDSRIYRIRQKHIKCLTEDHSLMNEWVRMGAPVDKWSQFPRNVITRAVGLDERVEAEADTGELEDGDLFLLCTDGLTGDVSEAAILHIILTAEGLQKACEDLVAQAIQNGGSDNITAVLVRAYKIP